jgi:hypothetical protein
MMWSITSSLANTPARWERRSQNGFSLFRDAEATLRPVLVRAEHPKLSAGGTRSVPATCFLFFDSSAHLPQLELMQDGPQ